MFRMKRDAVICALITSLSLAVPLIGYAVLSETLLAQREEAVNRANRFDEMARNVQDERIVVHKEKVAVSLHHYATAERSLSQMYENSHAIAIYFVVFTGGIALCQFIFLYLFILNRSRHDGFPPGMPATIVES